MSTNFQRNRSWLWLTVPIIVLVILVSAVGLWVPNFYRGSLAWTSQAVSQDFIDLVIVLPVLVISGLLAFRGSQRALLIWMGALSYLLYTFVIYAFDAFFNPLFLAYVAALGCCLWALMGSMASTDWSEIRKQFTSNTPVKVISILLLVQVLLFYAAWLKEDIPALFAGIVPVSVTEVGLPTNPVHVMDMAVALPAITLAAIWLWRKRPLGYGLTAVLLTNLIFQSVNVAFLLAGSGLTLVFGLLAILDLALLVWHLSHMKPAVVLKVGQATVQPLTI